MSLKTNPNPIRTMILAVLLTSILGGCTAPPTQPDEKKPASMIEPSAGGYADVPLTNATGALVGQVMNQYEVPIAGVHGALIGSDHSVTTNASGWFQFTNLTPAKYFLRIDHPDYHAAESQITVQAAKVTTVTVRLLERPGVSAAQRPHAHDYWGGRTRVTVMDHAMKYHSQNSGGFEGPAQPYTGPLEHAYTGACLSGKEIRSSATGLIRFPDEHQLIWPGTDRIEVTLNWTTQDYIHERVSLVWHGADSREYQRSPLFPKGKPFSIPVAPTQTDSGHQRFTAWEIAVCTSEAGETASYGRPFLGNVHIKVDLIGGTKIPIESAHPDFWANGSIVSVVNETKVIPYSPNQYWLTTARSGRYDFTFLPAATKLVPPETSYLEVKLSWTYDGTVNTRPVSLTYSPGSVAPWNRWMLDQRLAPKPAETGPNTRSYNVTVSSDDADTVYQQLSTWAFYWNFEGEERQDYAIHSCACRLEITLTVNAVRS